MTPSTATILTAFGVALALTGCGGDKPAAARDGPAATPPPQAADSPYGTYVRRVTKADLARTRRIRSESGPSLTAPPTGRYRLTIAKGSGQSVLKSTQPDGFTIDMDVDLRDGELVTTAYVDPARAAFCGEEMPVRSTYRFRADATTLRLAPDGVDGCADRDAVLTGRWTRG
jgi:hypothetical protein